MRAGTQDQLQPGVIDAYRDDLFDQSEQLRHMCNLETVNTDYGSQDIHALILGYAQTNRQAVM